ncbi:MAG: MFS transporter [Candidatus Verstraetearchaeota archaeon]|nr:MFS transporter [Candidatus Verstraetearchaeota archaeon]
MDWSISLNALVLTYLCAFLGPFGGNIVIAMFPTLEAWFNVDVSSMALSITLFMLPFCTMYIFGGSLSDAYGRGRVLSLGLLIYGVGSLTAAFSPNIAAFLASRAIQGCGAGIMSPTAMALLGDVVPSKNLGKAMGGYSVAVTAGMAFGTLMGGAFAAFNWTSAFIVMCLAALALALISLKMPSKRRANRDMTAAWRGFIQAARNRVVFLAGIIGFIAFIVRVGVITYAADALGKPPYQVNPENIGVLISISGFAGLLAGPASGYLSDRIGRFQTALIGVAALIATSAILALPQWAQLMPLIMVLLGIGGTTIFTPLGAESLDVLPAARGAASSVFGFLRFLGYALGPIILLYPYTTYYVQGVAVVSLAATIAAAALIINYTRSQKDKSPETEYMVEIKAGGRRG